MTESPSPNYMPLVGLSLPHCRFLGLFANPPFPSSGLGHLLQGESGVMAKLFLVDYFICVTTFFSDSALPCLSVTHCLSQMACSISAAHSGIPPRWSSRLCGYSGLSHFHRGCHQGIRCCVLPIQADPLFPCRTSWVASRVVEQAPPCMPASFASTRKEAGSFRLHSLHRFLGVSSS